MKIVWFVPVFVAALFLGACQAQETGWSSVSDFAILPSGVKTYQQWVNSGETVLIESLAGKIYVALTLGTNVTTIQDGSRIITWPYYVQKPQSTLEWKLIRSNEKGYYYIVSTYDDQTRIVNQVSNSISLLNITGTDAESGKVYFEDAGNGYYYILYKSNNQALTYGNVSQAHLYSSGLVASPVEDKPEFKWRILIPDSIPRLEITEQQVIIRSGVDNTFISIMDGNLSKSASLDTAGYSTDLDIQWVMSIPGPPVVGYYFLVSALDDNKVLQQSGKSFTNGGVVALWTRSDLTNTEVAFRDAGDGWFNIVFRHSGLVVRVDPDPLTPLTQWEIIDAPEYKWKFMTIQNDAEVNIFSTPCCQD